MGLLKLNLINYACNSISLIIWLFSPLIPRRQPTWDALDCCKRSSTLNLILRYHGSISTWTTLSTFCWIFLQLPKVGVITVLTRKPKSLVFQAYLLQKETKCVLNAYILYQKPIIMFGNDLVIIVTYIRVQLTYFTWFYWNIISFSESE